MATAKQIMNPNVELIARSATVEDAIEQMNNESISSLIVEKLSPRDTYGIVTMGDIVTKVVAQGLPLNEVKVFEIMTKPLIIVMPELSIKHVARLFAQNEISRAPVVENNEIIGLITLHDILADPHLIDQMR